MDAPVDFEWDEGKAAANLAKHNVSFPFAAAVFLDPERVEFDASHDGDGEERRKAVGQIGPRLFTVVFTLRGDRVRLISARRSNRSEERRYGTR